MNSGISDSDSGQNTKMAGLSQNQCPVYRGMTVRVIPESVSGLLRNMQKHQKAFMVDINLVYRAVNRAAAESALDELETKWGVQYPLVLESWRRKWVNLSVYFQYPEYIRKAINTTNAIEAVHRQFRKLTKTKGALLNENSLLKLLYVSILNASKKWTMPIYNWNLTLSQLAIHFNGRLNKILEI